MKVFQSALALLLLMTLGGCAHRFPATATEGPPASRCRLPVVKLSANEFDDPDDTSARSASLHNNAGASLSTSLAKMGSSTPQALRMLVLSGGSQHGAFGAGFFLGMRDAGEKLDYDVVTGISTGALQSTFVFLADRTEAPETGKYDAVPFLKRRAGVVAPVSYLKPLGTDFLSELGTDYTPDREADILKLYPLAKVDSKGVGLLDAVIRGSMANMEPLHEILESEIDPETIRAVAVEAERGRKLYVGIADLINGYGYAADLTKLAQLAAYPDKYRRDSDLLFDGLPPTPEARLEAARRCYADALVASSSVPPGVGTQSIEIIKLDDNGNVEDPNHSDRVAARHAFIDGGAAFAVFLSQLSQLPTDASHIDVDLIVNGTYYPQIWDKYESLCDDGKERHCTKSVRNIKATIADVAVLSSNILQGQVRLFSVQEVRRWAQAHGTLRWTFISNRKLLASGQGDETDKWETLRASGPGEIPGGRALTRPDDWKYPSNPVSASSKTCLDWEKYDQNHDHPMEFEVSYMKCLLDYGYYRGRTKAIRWNYVSR